MFKEVGKIHRDNHTFNLVALSPPMYTKGIDKLAKEYEEAKAEKLGASSSSSSTIKEEGENAEEKKDEEKKDDKGGKKGKGKGKGQYYDRTAGFLRMKVMSTLDGKIGYISCTGGKGSAFIEPDFMK